MKTSTIISLLYDLVASAVLMSSMLPSAKSMRGKAFVLWSEKYGEPYSFWWWRWWRRYASVEGGRLLRSVRHCCG